MEELEEMLRFIIDEGEKVGFEKKILQRVRLACEEILVNIINYAYPENGGEIELAIDEFDDGNGLLISIIDSGVPFDPLAKTDPNIDAPIEEREIGGLGIYLVKKVMDEVEYSRKTGRNTLRLVKYKNQ